MVVVPKYTGTTIQHVSRAINIVGVILMALYIFFSHRNNKKKTLFAVDLDGTLMDRSGEMTGSVCEKINRSIEDGKNIVIATARTPATVCEKLKNINVKYIKLFQVKFILL